MQETMSSYRALTRVKYGDNTFEEGQEFLVKDKDAAIFGWDRVNGSVEKVVSVEQSADAPAPEAAPEAPAAISTDQSTTVEPTPEVAPATEGTVQADAPAEQSADAPAEDINKNA